jgi:hypothetical protein
VTTHGVLCLTPNFSTITEKKVRRQVEEELGLEDKILDGDPYKSIVKEIVNKILVSKVFNNAFPFLLFFIY